MDDFWAITAYFNPVGYSRRRTNYHLFRQHLEVPLLTVELGRGGAFELSGDDADILVQIPGHDVMWQKERLLNRALEALPAQCTKVAWLDADLIFQSKGWSRRTAALLDRHALVQPFGRVLRTTPAWRPGAAPGEADVLDAVARHLDRGGSIASCLDARGEAARTALGMGWAAHRALLARHGLYDANIVGDGDSLLVAAALGCIEAAVAQQRMGPRREAHFRAWAEPFHAAVGGSIGCASGDVAHLWHGELKDRRYAERIEDFRAFGFDPAEDVADADGAWRWNSAKPAMHAFVRDYFAGRREDGAAARV